LCIAYSLSVIFDTGNTLKLNYHSCLKLTLDQRGFISLIVKKEIKVHTSRNWLH